MVASRTVAARSSLRCSCCGSAMRGRLRQPTAVMFRRVWQSPAARRAWHLCLRVSAAVPRTCARRCDDGADEHASAWHSVNAAMSPICARRPVCTFPFLSPLSACPRHASVSATPKQRGIIPSFTFRLTHACIRSRTSAGASAPTNTRTPRLIFSHKKAMHSRTLAVALRHSLTLSISNRSRT